MSAAPAVPSSVVAWHQLLIMLYPGSWRDRHEQEALAILADDAAENGGRLPLGSTLDLIMHAVAARIDAGATQILGKLPRRVRPLPGLVALTIAAVLSVIMLVGEIFGALHRPSPVPYSQMFISGPFLTIGVGLDIGFLLATLLIIGGRPGLARIVLFATVVLAVWMTVPGGLQPYPQPPSLITAVGLVLGAVALGRPFEVSGRVRAVIAVAVVGLSGIAIALLALATSRIGWAPLESFNLSGQLFGWWAGYVIMALIVVTSVVAAVVIAVRHRQYGGLLLVALAALIISTMHAVASSIGSEPLTAWLWPAALLVAAMVMITVLRRRLSVPSSVRT